MPNKKGFGNTRTNRGRNKETAQLPLRLVVSEGVDAYNCVTNTLECGHTILAPSDFVGVRDTIVGATRRKCFVKSSTSGEIST